MSVPTLALTSVVGTVAFALTTTFSNQTGSLAAILTNVPVKMVGTLAQQRTDIVRTSPGPLSVFVTLDTLGMDPVALIRTNAKWTEQAAKTCACTPKNVPIQMAVSFVIAEVASQ
jgi:hypothetical protein